MILTRRLARLFACCSLLAVSAWAIGCAEPTVEDPAANGEVGAPGEAPADPALDAPAGDAGLEGGSSTGAGTEVPDPLEQTEDGPELNGAAPTPAEPEPETP